MSRRSRILLALLTTTALVALVVSMLVLRALYWNREGFVGLTYVPHGSAGDSAFFGVEPGQVAMTYPGSPADHHDIRFRDEILSINGVPVTDKAGLRALDERLHRGDGVVYHLRRGKEERRIALQLEAPFPNRMVVVSAIVTGTVASAFIIIGLVVFSRQPEDRRARVFYAMTTVGAASLLSSTLASVELASVRGIVAEPQPFTLGLLALVIFTFAFIPLTLHLALVFPKDRPVLRAQPAVLRWVYSVPVTAVAMVGFFAFLIGAVQEKESEAVLERALNIGSGALGVIGLIVALRVARLGRIEGMLRAFAGRPVQTLGALFGFLIAVTRVFGALKLKIPAVTFGVLTSLLPFLLMASYPVLACVALYRSYRESGLEERRQVKWPLWGTLFALAFKAVFFVAFNGLAFFLMFREVDLKDWFPVLMAGQLIPILVYLLIPISFAVAILKYRLMNIDVIIKKTVVYAMLSGVIIVLYLALVGGLGTVLVQVAGVKNQTMVIASTLVVALVFVPIRNKLQFLVERNLFRQKYDYPQALAAISGEALTTNDLTRFLLHSAETLQQALQNRAVVIFQRGAEDFVAAAKVGVADSLLGALRLSAKSVELLPQAVDPRGGDLPEKDRAALARVGTALLVPMRAHGQLLGAVALAGKLSDRPFEPEDREFVSAAADQMAVAVDRMRMQQDEADFEQAKKLQQGLLPAEPPQIPGLDVDGLWQPARAVGGDYYDLIKLSDTQLALCIGDVAGKGMPAALLMSSLQGALRASASEDAPPREVCQRVRRVVIPSLAGRFVSFFYCTIDTKAREIRFCNAGHNPPVLVRGDGTIERLSAGGPVFTRLFRNAPLEDGRLELREGDRLVLFTDGVSEARHPLEGEFGEERLGEIVAASQAGSARELTSAVTAAVMAFTGGRLDDDFTLVSVLAVPAGRE